MGDPTNPPRRGLLPPGPEARAAFHELGVPRQPDARTGVEIAAMVRAGLVSSERTDCLDSGQLAEEAREVADGTRLDIFDSPLHGRYLPRPEPSALVRASALLMAHWHNGVMPTNEIERRAEGAERLRRAFSAIPFYASGARSDPDYWNNLYSSRATW